MTRRERIRQAERKRNIMIGALLLITIIASSLGTLAASNQLRKQAMEPTVDATMASCEQDGTLKCRVEWEYKGAVLVDFRVYGTPIEE